MRKLLCCFLALTLVMVSGCGIMDWIFPDDKIDPEENGEDYVELPETENEGETSLEDGRILYVADMLGNFCLPVTYDIPFEEGIAKAVVRHLVEGGPAQEYLSTNGFKAVLPAGTDILGMKVDEGNCIVDFSEEFLQTADEVHERLMLEALTYTLTEFPNIDSVTIWVNGFPLTEMPHGTIVDPKLTRDGGINSTSSAKGTGAAVTVYMRLDSMGSRLLVPVTRPVASAINPVESALEQLIGGPSGDSNLSGALPAGTRVQDLTANEGTAQVDFSSELATADDMDVAVAAVVLTLTELPSIDSVVMTIDGEPVTLSDGSVLAEPVLRPSSANPLAF